MIEANFSNFEWRVDIDEICKSMGLLGEGIYIQILEDLIGYINNDFTNGEIINLCVKIKIGIEVLKNNYRYIEEQRLTNKLSDNDLDSFSDIDLLKIGISKLESFIISDISIISSGFFFDCSSFSIFINISFNISSFSFSFFSFSKINDEINEDNMNVMYRDMFGYIQGENNNSLTVEKYNPISDVLCKVQKIWERTKV